MASSSTMSTLSVGTTGSEADDVLVLAWGRSAEERRLELLGAAVAGRVGERRVGERTVGERTVGETNGGESGSKEGVAARAFGTVCGLMSPSSTMAGDTLELVLSNVVGTGAAGVSKKGVAAMLGEELGMGVRPVDLKVAPDETEPGALTGVSASSAAARVMAPVPRASIGSVFSGSENGLSIRVEPEGGSSRLAGSIEVDVVLAEA